MRPYAGLTGQDRPGLFVEENALLLRRYAYVEQRLFLLEAGHFPGTAIWELKHALARHAWEDAQHADALRRRIVTMRTSPRLLDQCPDPALQALLDEVERAADAVELTSGVYGVVKPALLAAYRWHLATSNPVADFPTVRELEIMLREEAHQLLWAAEALAELGGQDAAEPVRRELLASGVVAGPPVAATGARGVAERSDGPAADGAAAAEGAPSATGRPGPPVGAPLAPAPGAAERARAWQDHLGALLRAAGGITGREPRPAAAAPPPRGTARFRISRHPRRDGRFAVNFQFNEPGDPPAETVPEKLVFMMRGRLNELAATENVASAIYELAAEGVLPWEGLLELARHMWDEARHSMLGQAVLEQLGHDIREWPLRIGPGYGYLALDALERYAHLGLNVEQGMMRYPPGKRQEFEWCRDVARHALAAMYQDYDWADEVYHTQIARRWVGHALGARTAGAAGGDGVPEALRALAAAAAEKIARRTAAVAEVWHERRAHGGTLAEGDPLPDWAVGEPAQDAAAAPQPASEYATPPELTLTAEQVEADLRAEAARRGPPVGNPERGAG